MILFKIIILVRQRNWRTLTFTNTNYYHVQNEAAVKGGGGASFNVHQYKLLWEAYENHDKET